MSADDWADLARLAEAATPGPWEVDDDDCGMATPDAPMVATPWVGGRRTHIVGSPVRPHGKPLPENAEFIAAANPATILRLIAEVDRWKARATHADSKLAVVAAAIDRADPPGRMKVGTPSVSVAVLRAALGGPK